VSRSYVRPPEVCAAVRINARNHAVPYAATSPVPRAERRQRVIRPHIRGPYD